MNITGFKFPKIDLGKVQRSTSNKVSLNNIGQLLKKATGDFFKTGFEAAKKSLFQGMGRMLGIPQPPAALGTKAPAMPAPGSGPQSASTKDGVGSSDARSLIEYEMGKDVTKDWDKMPKSVKEDLERQAALQRMSRVGQTMTNILQSLHEMNKVIIQNFRV